MVIKNVQEQSAEGLYTVTAFTGAAFFIRQEYLSSIKIDDIIENVEFLDEKEDELINAGFAVAAEYKAVDYLSRAEQSKFGLSRKLLLKGYQKNVINMVLLYLESKNYLSDYRYAIAWLHSRRINHFEGRSRLLGELILRGIDRETVNKALDNYFGEYDESAICKKAMENLVKKGKLNDELISYLVKAGFSYKMIRTVLSSENDS